MSKIELKDFKKPEIVEDLKNIIMQFTETDSVVFFNSLSIYKVKIDNKIYLIIKQRE